MSYTVVFGSNNSRLPMLHFLPPRFDIPLASPRVEVVMAPLGSLTWVWDEPRSEISSNINIAYLEIGAGSEGNCSLGDLRNTQYLKNESLKIVTTARHHKLTQAMILSALGRKHAPDSKITPRTWGTINSEVYKLNLPSDIDWYVLKPAHAARGAGQIKFNLRTTAVPDVVEWSKKFDQDSKELPPVPEGMEMFLNLANFNDNDNFRSLRRDLYIQECLLDIVKEYRVLAFKGKYWVVDRKIDYTNYPQATVGRDHHVIPQEMIRSDGLFPDYVFNIMDDLMVETPIMSVDLYQRADGSFGFFEWSNEFSLDYLDHEWRQNWLKAAVISVIEQHYQIKYII